MKFMREVDEKVEIVSCCRFMNKSVYLIWRQEEARQSFPRRFPLGFIICAGLKRRELRRELCSDADRKLSSRQETRRRAGEKNIVLWLVSSRTTKETKAMSGTMARSKS